MRVALGGRCGASEARAAFSVAPVVITSSISTRVAPFSRSKSYVLSQANAAATFLSLCALGSEVCGRVWSGRVRRLLRILSLVVPGAVFIISVT